MPDPRDSRPTDAQRIEQLSRETGLSRSIAAEAVRLNSVIRGSNEPIPDKNEMYLIYAGAQAYESCENPQNNRPNNQRNYQLAVEYGRNPTEPDAGVRALVEDNIKTVASGMGIRLSDGSPALEDLASAAMRVGRTHERHER